MHKEEVAIGNMAIQTTRYSRLFVRLTFIACLTVTCIHPLFAADLNDLYGPLLQKCAGLYQADIEGYKSNEQGAHGNAIYDKFDAGPDFFSIGNKLTFAPGSSFNARVGLKGIIPATYSRYTYGLTDDSLDSVQEYKLEQFWEGSFLLRARRELVEFYIDGFANRQKSMSRAAPHPAAENFFPHARGHFEDVKGGMRYLSEDETKQPKSNLSKAKSPLLDKNQITIDTGVGYKHGKATQRTYYHFSTWTYYYNYSHHARPHFKPYITFNYGILDNLELGTGIAYTTPFKYHYEFKQFNPTGASRQIDGLYKFRNNIHVPVSARYRLRRNIEISANSDISIVNQKLEYKEKAFNGQFTLYSSKGLSYYNTKPTLSLTYMSEAGKDIREDEFSRLTKNLLRERQWLFEVTYQRDITHLSKNDNNGPQNIIDPYNVFLYPLNLFVMGTEYAALLTGNSSTSATNIKPQNYDRIQVGLTYGLSDNVNLGAEAGYQSSSNLHHFTLGAMRGRHYTFKPNYYLDFLWDWRMGEDSMLSFNSHIVPCYRTIMRREENPKEFESEVSYFEVVLSFKALF